MFQNYMPILINGIMIKFKIYFNIWPEKHDTIWLYITNLTLNFSISDFISYVLKVKIVSFFVES